MKFLEENVTEFDATRFYFINFYERKKNLFRGSKKILYEVLYAF